MDEIIWRGWWCPATRMLSITCLQGRRDLFDRVRWPVRDHRSACVPSWGWVLQDHRIPCIRCWEGFFHLWNAMIIGEMTESLIHRGRGWRYGYWDEMTPLCTISWGDLSGWRDSCFEGVCREQGWRYGYLVQITPLHNKLVKLLCDGTHISKVYARTGDGDVVL